MIINEWTPKGWLPAIAKDAAAQMIIISGWREMVRETAYNLTQIEVSAGLANDFGQDYSRACELYRIACHNLVKYSDEQSAREFIDRTYKPQTYTFQF